MAAIGSLISKEWREERWKAAFGAVLLAGMAAIGLRARFEPDGTIIGWNVLIGGFLIPGFVAMGLVARERAAGTLATLLALPVSPWKVLLAKTLVGAVASAVPLLAALAVSMPVAGREASLSTILAIHLLAVLLAWIVLIWVLSLSIRARTEARAGIIFIAILLVWMSMTVLFEMSPSRTSSDGSVFRHAVGVLSPFGLLMSVDRMAQGEGAWWTVLPPAAVPVCLWLAAGFLLAKPGRGRS